MYCQ